MKIEESPYIVIANAAKQSLFQAAFSFSLCQRYPRYQWKKRESSASEEILLLPILIIAPDFS